MPHRDNPLLEGLLEVRQLSGLSGAEIYLATEDGRTWFVRKLAATPEAGKRLKVQAAKQQAFVQRLPEPLHTPRILRQEEVDGRFYFDMEFIRGMDGTNYLQRGTYAEICRFTDQLCDYLRLASAHAPLANSGSGNLFEAMFAKLVQVQAATSLIPPSALTQLFLGLERVRGLGNLPATVCHGDLTLENLVVDASGKIWVLDLLDAPYEHYWQDVAKLHQDLAGGWYLRKQEPISKCVTHYVSQRVLATVQELHPGYPLAHELLVASTFVRILPYAKTAEQRDLVLARIEHFASRLATPSTS